MRYIPGRCLLRQHLDKKKLTLRWLHENTGIAESQLSDYQIERTKMGYATAYTIAKALNLKSGDDLYEWIPMSDDRQGG